MLSLPERKHLLAHARASVEAAAGGASSTMPPSPAGMPSLASPAGAFVTLHAAGGELRGCIGFVEARRPLWTTVWAAARDAALEDPRFDAVRPSEVRDLLIEISVLSPLQPALPRNVRVGEHGIVLSLGPRRGLLLPQVATERGWSRERFLDAGCEKAGLPRDAWRTGASLEVFTAEVFGER